jgi:hypothetical protein
MANRNLNMCSDEAVPRSFYFYRLCLLAVYGYSAFRTQSGGCGIH